MAVVKRTYVDFGQHQPIVETAAVGQIGVVTDAAVNFAKAGSVTFEMRNEQANADIIPTLVLDADGAGGAGALGWQIPNDNADNDGVEIGRGVLDSVNASNVYKIGTTGAFQISVKISIPDVSEYDVCAVGFRKTAAYLDAVNAAAALGTVPTDVACLNVNAGDIYTVTRLNSGTATVTDTGDNWADDAAKTLTVKVSAAGVVTFEIDGAAPTTNTNTLTFDTGDTVIPFFIATKAAANTDTPPILMTWYDGLQ